MTYEELERVDGVATAIEGRPGALDLVEAARLIREMKQEIEGLREALALVRVDICTGPVNDTLWRQAEPNETTVDFICNTLHDDWDYDKWLAEQRKGPE